MKYMLMLYVQESGWDELTPAQQAEGMAAYVAYGEALEKAGAFVATDRLAGVGLDVLPVEPVPSEHPLLTDPRVIFSPSFW